MRKFIAITLFGVSLCCAQGPIKVCHKWDWKHAHEVQVQCKLPNGKAATPSSKPRAVLIDSGHAFVLVGEGIGIAAMTGALIYFTALNPSGVQVH